MLVMNFLALSGVSAQVHPKVNVSGTVLSSQNNTPIVGATVMMLNQEGKTVDAVFSDENGLFNLSASKNSMVSISISFIGFPNYKIDSLKIENQDIVLPNIILEEKSTELNEVVVVGSAKKPLVESKKDGLVYNASSDIANKSGNATDVLRKVPMLTVDATGDIKMRGNSNIKVLINGVPSAILAKNLKEALKAIPASTIASIEVITNPSARYEAEGAGGVINIITKKKLKGRTGSLNLSTGNLEQSGNLNLGLSTGKFDWSGTANFTAEKERSFSYVNRTLLGKGENLGQIIQERDALQRSTGGFYNLTSKYNMDSLQSIEGSVSLWNGSWPEKSQSRNQYKNILSNNSFRQDSKQEGNFNYYEFLLNYQKKFKREGQSFQFIGQTSMSDDISKYITNQFSNDGKLLFTEKSPNSGKEKDWSLQSDYTHPFNKSGSKNLETGFRYYQTHSFNSYSVENTHQPVDPSRNGNMNFTQDILALYASVNYKTGADWTFRTGIRYENTQNRAELLDKTNSFNTRFQNWVPNFLVSKTLNEAHELKFNYSERIRRPWIWDLNPYINASDPLNITVGNPNLKPERIVTAELGHAFNASDGTSIMSSLYFKSNRNAVESIVNTNENGVSTTTSENIGLNDRWGLNLNTSFDPISNWNISAGGDLYYLNLQSKSLNLQKKGMFYNLNFNSSYAIARLIDISASANYGNGYITIQGKNAHSLDYQVAIKRDLFNKKASLTLVANNFFNSNFKQSSWIYDPSFHTSSVRRMYNRSFAISFNWHFGNLKNADKEGPSQGMGSPRGGRREGF